MKYVLLIYEDQTTWSSLGDTEKKQLLSGYRAFTEEVRASGHMTGGAQLVGPSSATSIQVRDGKRLVHDGPFAETREFLGGFYIVEAKDLDEAMAIAERIPSAKIGTIEIRPMVTQPS